MAKWLAIIYNDKDRQRIIEMIMRAVPFSRVEIADPQRTIPQNKKMRAMIGDIVKQKKTLDGRTFDSDQWKAIFMQAAGTEPEILPTIDGGFFATTSSSKLSVKEMSDVIECIYAFGAENGVEWSDPELKSQEAMMR